MTAPRDNRLPAPGERAAERSGISGPLRGEVVAGLTSNPKTLPPKLFYDATGATLFERITTLPEYYLTRAELEILTARAARSPPSPRPAPHSSSTAAARE
jgi:uncharacterized SAM-dependent methyltransferase